MIMSVEELKGLIPSITEDDVTVEFKLKGIEQLVKSITNNDFSRYETYPDDIKLGVVNLIKWDSDNRDKLGVASESISRHSVSYSGLTNAESEAGYPASLMRFLDPYRKARF